LLLLLVLLPGGCGTAHYRKSADKEAARIIAQKTPAVPNMDPRFTIEPSNEISLAGLTLTTNLEAFLGNEGLSESNAPIVSLESALALAVQRNRDYQNQKELVYLEALNLSLDRYRFTPIFSSGGNVTAQNQPQDVARAIDQLAGTQTALLSQDTKLVQQYNVSGRGTAGASMLLRTGATLASSFSLDFLRFLNGDPRFLVQSSLGATLTQPLLRGAGYRATMENLTQSEHNLLYRLREFTQYRKDFSVRVARDYYGVLQTRDQTRNQYLGYQNFLQNVRRGQANAEEGRIAQAELGQLQQAALSAEARWINAVRSYKQNLDQFKLTLGLPAEARLVLDERELTSLRVLHPDLGVEEAMQVALNTRLDLQTAKDQRADALRRIKVAANGLLPRVDFTIGGRVDSKPGNNPLDLDYARTRGSAGLNFDLGLDRKAERNSYRGALIAAERAARQAELQTDQVKLQIADDWRNLDQAKRSHEISDLGVQLAERRVEEQQLRADLGRGTARDLVEAQTALITSHDERIAALVNHTIARLQFWRDMGILFIKEDGKWEELTHAKR